MRIGNKIIKGKLGNWLVEVTWDDGRKAMLPCVHHRFYNDSTKRYAYNAIDMQKSPGKLRAWEAAIVKHKAVVVTDDDWIGDTPKRTGYHGVFAITDLKLDGSNHSFTVTRWL